MKGFRPSHFDVGDSGQTDLLQANRERRIPHYAERAAKGQPLFDDDVAPEPLPAAGARRRGRARKHITELRPFRSDL